MPERKPYLVIYAYTDPTNADLYNDRYLTVLRTLLDDEEYRLVCNEAYEYDSTNLHVNGITVLPGDADRPAGGVSMGQIIGAQETIKQIQGDLTCTLEEEEDEGDDDEDDESEDA